MLQFMMVHRGLCHKDIFFQLGRPPGVSFELTEADPPFACPGSPDVSGMIIVFDRKNGANQAGLGL